eukprot:COSAG03_NODE_860_length_5596_cov_16.024195_1_plen_244_part_10
MQQSFRASHPSAPRFGICSTASSVRAASVHGSRSYSAASCSLMSERAWGGQQHEKKGCRSPQALRRCLRRPRIVLPLVLALIIFLGTNTTVGRLWRGVHGCASQKWAALNDGQYELGESIHTLESLGFQPHAVRDITHTHSLSLSLCVWGGARACACVRARARARVCVCVSQTVSQVLDIGANEGNWVTAMKKKLPEAAFFCVEGNEALEEILKPRVESLGTPLSLPPSLSLFLSLSLSLSLSL